MTKYDAFRLVIGAAATLACTACGNSFTGPQPTEITVDVQGTITALDTGVPVDSAFIEVRTEFSGGFAEDFSDDTGHYAYSFVYRFFPGEVFCPFLVFVSANGFLQEILSLRCVEGTQTVDIELEASPAVRRGR